MTTILIDTWAREEICRVGRRLFVRGYVHATADNISVRLDASQGDGYLITPTDACRGFLDPARLDDQALQVSSDRAIKTIAIHAAIYRATSPFDQYACRVIHTHSTYCVALTLQPGGEEPMPAVTPHFVMKVGHVPLIAYHRPGAPEAAQQVAQAICRYGEPVRRLAPSCWRAWRRTCGATRAPPRWPRWNNSKKPPGWCSLAPPSQSPRLTPKIDELRHTFGARW